MADHDDHTKKDDSHDDHDGGHGDHDSGSSGHAKPSSGGGSGVGKLLRNPVTWAVAGDGALLIAVFASGVPVPTVDTSPSSYDVSDSSPDVADGPPGERRSAARSRISARNCAAIVRRARADYGRDWEQEMSRKQRADCGRAIEEARRADGRLPQQAEGPRATGPGVGAGDVEVQRLSVAYGDLDLNTSAGAQRFLDRLRQAAVRVCGGRPDIRDFEARRAFKACVDRSMDRAVAEIRAPRVTQLHRQTSG
jgi:UrcA family protein